MKKHSVLSIILAAVICLSSLVMSASALLTGDIDGDGTVTASDARLVLRASVGLESFSEAQNKLADADADSSITAADARLVLRASVGLEDLGEIEEEPKEKHPENHSFTTISMTGETKCAYEGCDASLPSFNSIVNVLKTSEGGAVRFTEIAEYVDFTDKTELSGPLAFMMKDSIEPAKTEKSYDVITEKRYLTSDNFPTEHERFVSDLSDSDVKSVTLEKVSGIGFTSALPDTITSGSTTYKLSALKSASYPELYKITIVLPDESIDITKEVTGTSAYDKIYYKDYNKNLEATRSRLITEIEKESAMFKEYDIDISTTGSITSRLTVEYYVDAETLAPVAARYLHTFRNTFSVEIPLAITMTQSMDISENTCYIFNPDFSLVG